MVDKKLFDVGIFKAALEFAKFSDPDVREALMQAINALDADLDEVSYDPSDLTMEAFENLIEALNEDTDTENKASVDGTEVENGLDEDIEDFIQDEADEAEEVEFDEDDEPI